MHITRKLTLGLLLLGGAIAPAAWAVNIDDFSAAQAVITASTATPSNSACIGPSAGIFGGSGNNARRCLLVKQVGGGGNVTADVATTTAGQLTFTVAANTNGELEVSWDADTSAATFNPSGLAPVDLTTGNAQSFALSTFSTGVAVSASIEAYTDATHASRGGRIVPIGGALANQFVSFGEMASFGSAGALDPVNLRGLILRLRVTTAGTPATLKLDLFDTQAPALASQKTAALQGPADGVDPGDTVRYSVTITNTGGEAKTIALNDTVDPGNVNVTVVGGSVKATPVAKPDQYVGTGNISLTRNAAQGVIANDIDPDGGAVTATAGTFPTSLGGSVTLAADGSFTYTPLGGTRGVDSFTYTANDGDTPNGTATGTVSIDLRGMVWFVDNTAACPCFGTQAKPFQTLPDAEGISLAGDTIYVRTGNSTTTPYAAGITLKANQSLLGEGVALLVDGVQIYPSGTQPRVVVAAGNAVTIANAIPLEIRGLSLGSTAANAIDLTSTGVLTGASMLTISSDEIRNAAAEGVDINLNAGTNGTVAVVFTGNSWNVAGTHTGNAFDARTASATANLRLDVSNNTNVVSAAGGIVVDGSGGGSIIVTNFAGNTVHQNTGGTGISVASAKFDATPADAAYGAVAGGSTAIGIPGNGVGGSGILLSTVSGDLGFTDLDVFADNGTGLFISGTGAVNVGAGTGTRVTVGASVGTIEATSGPALDLSNLTADLQLSSAKSTNTATRGISIVNVADGTTNANVSAAAGSITTTAGATGPIFNLSGGNADVSYAGTISNSGTGRAVLLDGWNGDDGTDDITLSGAITENGAGILVNNNGGTRPITFSGGMTITTTTGEGFAATSNATTGGLHVTGTNIVSSTSATALRITNTAIGNSNVTFRSVSSGNGTAAADPANGIVLNTTGAGGRLIVTGNSGSCTGIANCSGGVIRNTTGHGILLTSTTNPSFTRIAIQGTAGSGIEGTSVSSFTLDNSFVENSGTGGAADDSNVAFNDQASGTETNVSGVLTITNNILNTARWHGLMVQNFNGTLSDAVVTGNTITSSTALASSLGYGINFQILGSATTVSNLTKATISGNVISNFPSAGGIQVQGGNSNAAGPAGILGVAGNGTNIISIVSNSVRGQNNVNRMGTSAILYTVSGKGQGNVNISSNGSAANPIGNNIGTTIGVGANGNTTLTATTSNNFIEANHPGTTGDSGISGGVGITFGATDVADMTWTISNNNIRNVDGNGILAVSRGTNGTLKVKIQNNDVEAPQAGVRPGIRVDAGTTAVGTDNDVCLNISGNTSAGSGGSQGIGLRKQGTSTTVHAFGVNGMAATSSPGVETYVSGLNPAGNGTLLISATSGFTNCSLP